MEMKRLEIKYQGKPCYEILFTDTFEALPEELSALGFEGRKICIVTDHIVCPLYLEEVTQVLKKRFETVVSYVLPAGEEHKNLDEIRQLYAYLIGEKFDRKDLLIALGGGVVGDMTGFAAATYLRGIDFVQVPTTLLAQADSSIGGKTGVDLDGYKNMVGAFWMPRLVYTNLSTLKTLDARQFSAGFAEVMKHGLLKDVHFYTWLVDHSYEITDRDLETLGEMLWQSCNIKRMIVEKDPKETGDRALLNLGHTLGHAIEKTSGFTLLHGECVALGCVAAAYISWKKDMIGMEDYYEIRDMFVPFGLPISMEPVDCKAVAALTLSDKKTQGGKVRFVLLQKIGKAVISEEVTREEMENALQELIFDEKE